MNEATDAQMDFLMTLRDRVKRNYDSDILFYDCIEKVTGKRVTSDITKSQASQIIDMVKERYL